MLLLLVIAVQDIRKRTIHLILLVLVFLFSLIINHFEKELELRFIVTNMVFIFLNISGLFLYYIIKTKRLLNPLKDKIGLGDVIFFIAITPLFNLNVFALFFIVSLAASLLLHIFISKKKKHQTVPLAGYLSIFLIFFLLSDKFLDIKLFGLLC